MCIIERARFELLSDPCVLMIKINVELNQIKKFEAGKNTFKYIRRRKGERKWKYQMHQTKLVEGRELIPRPPWSPLNS